ncbi:MAG: corrinoid protein-associated methyltransferase CpaM [Anaerolineae bacterium]
MATVFMKWLETTPADYDRGLRLLTLGCDVRVKAHIAEMVDEGERVLEIGCGTGTLALMLARRGATVAGVDASVTMLEVARERIAAEGLEEQVELHHLDASLIADHFSPGTFDLIVSTLVFSELPPDEQRYVLQAARWLLAPGGRLAIADEVVPEGILARLAWAAVRLPLALVTWLLTRTTTHALHGFPTLLTEAGFAPRVASSYLGGSLQLFVARPAEEVGGGLAPPPIPRLTHRVTLRSLLVDLWAVFFRIIPPYPKVRPGLYRVGEPNRGSPVLVTGNFDLTVRRVVRELDGRGDCWLLVADSAGINVWCAAGGGYFTAEKVIAAVKSSGVEEVVDHRALVLPQLAACGVDGGRVHRETGWSVHWGPARARDIPAYLAAGRRKSDAMRWLTFPLRERIEMALVTLGFYGLLILVPLAIFWRVMFWPVTAALLGLSLFYAVVLPWLPGRDGLAKSVPLAALALAGLAIYSALGGHLPPRRLFNWTVGLVGLAVFTGAELQGMSPLMRGEQANWVWEGVIGTVLLAVYLAGSRLVNW